jgi:hypothetical protein
MSSVQNIGQATIVFGIELVDEKILGGRRLGFRFRKINKPQMSYVLPVHSFVICNT